MLYPGEVMRTRILDTTPSSAHGNSGTLSSSFSRYAQWSFSRIVELERSHITDDGEAMAHMCADGLGFAQLPHFLAKKGLNSGALVSFYPYLGLR